MSLKQTLQQNGIESAFLDDVVHEAASRLASNANSDGMTSQLSFLSETCCWEDDDILAAVNESCESKNEIEETYLKSGGNVCPNPQCGSKEIEGGQVNIDLGSCSQEVYCNICKHTWKDVYTLTGIDQ